MKYKLGTLIWDTDAKEWGIVISYDGRYDYETFWAKTIPVVKMSETDLEWEHFELYEV